MRLRRKTKREREQQRIEDEEYVRRARAGELTPAVEPEPQSEPVARTGLTVDVASFDSAERARVEAVELERHNRQMRLPDPLVPGLPTPSVVKPKQPENAGPPPEPQPRRQVMTVEPAGTYETESMAHAWEQHLATKAAEDDPMPPRENDVAWTAWWKREQLRRAGWPPEALAEIREKQALDRIDTLRERDIARTQDTPAARRRRALRYWRPRVHLDVLGGSRSFGESQTLNSYAPPGVKAGG